MRLATRPMWKSWIAMLCVALIAFVALESVSPAHAAAIPCDSASLSVSIDDVGAVDASGDAQNEDGSPADQQQRHHCCGAHTSSAPSLTEAGMPNQYASLVVMISSDDDALAHAPTGLERPPKTTAIV